MQRLDCSLKCPAGCQQREREIGYRFLGPHILHDTLANVILDEIAYAVQCVGCGAPAADDYRIWKTTIAQR